MSCEDDIINDDSYDDNKNDDDNNEGFDDEDNQMLSIMYNSDTILEYIPCVVFFML